MSIEAKGFAVPLTPNPLIALLSKEGIQGPSDFVALVGFVVSADSESVALRAGLASTETLTIGAADVLYSEQQADGGLALVIVRPEAKVSVTTSAVAYREKGDGAGSGSVQTCIDNARQACIDGRKLGGASQAQAEAACDDPAVAAIRESLCKFRGGFSWGGGLIIA